MSSPTDCCGDTARDTLRRALMAAHAASLERARGGAGARDGGGDQTGASAAERADSPPPVNATEAGVSDKAADYTAGMDAGAQAGDAVATAAAVATAQAVLLEADDSVLAASEEAGSSADTAYVKACKGVKRKAEDDVPHAKSSAGKKGKMNCMAALDEAACGAVPDAQEHVADDGPSTEVGVCSRMSVKVKCGAASDKAARGVVGDVQDNMGDVGHAEDVYVAGCKQVKAEAPEASDEASRGALAAVQCNKADDGRGQPKDSKDCEGDVHPAKVDDDSTARESYADQYAADVKAVENIGVSTVPMDVQLAHLQAMTIDHRTLSRLMSLKTDSVDKHLARSSRTYRAAVQWSAKCHLAMNAICAHGRRAPPSTAVASALEAMPVLQALDSAPNKAVDRAGLAATRVEDKAAPSLASAHARGYDDDDVVLVGVTLAEDNLKLTPSKGFAAPAEHS